MSPRFPSSLSSFSNHYRPARRPSRLTLTVAAATVAAITSVGVSAGVSAGAVLPAAAVLPAEAGGNLGAIGHAGAAAPVAGRARSLDAIVGTAPSGRQAPVRHTVRPRRPATPAAPYVFYDSVIPSAIPAHGLVATYATGPYAASPAQLAGRGPVLWIDVYGTDYQAQALDVEPSDATPSMAANWVWHRLSAHPNAIARLYTSISEWPAVQAAVATLPAWMRDHVRWWIADPTGVPHIVPGSDATQWYWGSSYDISTATPRF